MYSDVIHSTETPLVLAVVGDLHCNSTLGLCPPKFTLDDGGTYTPSKLQEQLWTCWTSYWAKVKTAAAGKELIVVVNGDMVEGFHHHCTQLVSENPADQFKMALDVMSVPVDLASYLYIVRGTEAHVGQSGYYEEELAQTLGAEMTPTGAFSHWYLRLVLNGTVFDFAHHASMGRLPWTSGNLLNRLAIEIELDNYRKGKTPPRYSVRSHNHRWGASDETLPVHVVGLAGWQGPTGYVQRIHPGALPQVGGLIFRLDDDLPAMNIVNYPWNIIDD